MGELSDEVYEFCCLVQGDEGVAVCDFDKASVREELDECFAGVIADERDLVEVEGATSDHDRSASADIGRRCAPNGSVGATHLCRRTGR
ncbi:hypothetical protein ABZT02_40835 [Streptomyces sp. NPDC005402]|uniref:hypothetical protein n=1 Tax=Streptomyces sp. NPDC005402 TaxID=3155338 RepID=UPI0033B12F5B